MLYLDISKVERVLHLSPHLLLPRLGVSFSRCRQGICRILPLLSMLVTFGMARTSCEGAKKTAGVVIRRDENGRNFFRTIPFRFLYFSIRFRICEIPFSYLRK
jgi:hypothetical protein